jgi:hypothetical protein
MQKRIKSKDAQRINAQPGNLGARDWLPANTGNDDDSARLRVARLPLIQVASSFLQLSLRTYITLLFHANAYKSLSP